MVANIKLFTLTSNPAGGSALTTHELRKKSRSSMRSRGGILKWKGHVLHSRIKTFWVSSLNRYNCVQKEWVIEIAKKRDWNPLLTPANSQPAVKARASTNDYYRVLYSITIIGLTPRIIAVTWDSHYNGAACLHKLDLVNGVEMWL